MIIEKINKYVVGILSKLQYNTLYFEYFIEYACILIFSLILCCIEVSIIPIDIKKICQIILS